MNLIACMLQKRYFWFLLSHRFFLCWAFRWYMLYRNFWAASGMRSFCTISRFCAAESAATGPPSSARCTAIAHRTMRAGPTAAGRTRTRSRKFTAPSPWSTPTAARIQNDRNTIRTKLVELGMAESTSNLDTLATAISGITNQGAVSATVQEGDTYTIPKGYHNGSGTVSGVSGGGNYNLQSKKVTPTKSQQSVTPDSGYYGLSDVTVAAIPSNYQDVSSVTATAADVLSGKIVVDSTGKTLTGTMANNGAVTKTLDTTTTSYTIAKGYHSGSGKVSITKESKSVTPTKSAQTVTPTSGKVLSSVSVAAIPALYVDTTESTTDAASAANILSGKKAWVNGSQVTGTMANNGATSLTIDGLTTLSVAVPAGYTSGGTVSLTDDIYDALAAI